MGAHALRPLSILSAPRSETVGLARRDALESLTGRERAVAAGVAQGLSNKRIAEALGISPNTVRDHVSGLLSKLNVQSRAAIAAWYTVASDLRRRERESPG